MGTESNRRATLADRHREIEREIQEQMQRPQYDETYVGELKKQKLKLKEELERLR